ncbi:MAG TPA: sulfatase [Sphingobacteriaceae bacterium]|nr:sulfatase [Sphingobacteriaceae bacterium]
MVNGNLLRFSWWILLMLWFGNSIAQSSISSPNILFLVADDAGWKDYGCYGHPSLKTPNIDKLAATGLKYTNAILTSSSCSPSRTSMLSGQYAHTIGTEDMHVPLPDSVKILPAYLKQKGYYTGNMFKTHYGINGEKQFDWYSNKHNDFSKFLDSAKTSPFFMWVGFNDPHRPYDVKEYHSKFDPAKVTVPAYLIDNLDTRQDLANYYSEIERLDQQIGVMLAQLEKRGLRENTLIIFLSDNGSPFPGAKGTLYDTGVGTPLIFSWPSRIRHNRTYKKLVSTIDLAPTVLDLTGLQIPKNMLGKSLLPIINKKGDFKREYAFSERNWHGIDEHLRSVRTLKYKLISNEYETLPHGSPSDLSDSPSWKSLYVLNKSDGLTASQKRIFLYPRPKLELYNLKKDPNEMQNLASDPKYTKILEGLSNTLRVWQVSTKDVSLDDHLKQDKTDRFTGNNIK